MTRSRYQVLEPSTPHFVTCTIVNWLPIFASTQAAQIVLNSLGHLHQQEKFLIYAYVILENHLHLVVSGESLSRQIARFKSYSARSIIDWLKVAGRESTLKQLTFAKLHHKNDRDYQLWQEGSHPQHIQNLEMLRQKVEYIHQNPVRRGYVDKPAHWRYSSARDYEGGTGLLPVCKSW